MTPAQSIIATLDACQAGLDHQSCPDQAHQEPTPQYAARVLGYALTFGIEPLDLPQLEIADSYAARIVASLPAELDQDGRRLDATLHALRLRLAVRMAGKRRQRLALQRLMDELSQEPDPLDAEAPAGASMVESDADRAARLLRAALTLIMQTPPSSNGGGGRPAPLVPPAPTRPPGGQYATPDPPVTRRRF